MTTSDENDRHEDGLSGPGELFDGVEGVQETDWSGSLLRIEERTRGLLSDTDRKYLAGLKDYKHEQSGANRRQEIRERVVNGLQDFLLLWCLIDEAELAKIFAELQADRVLNDSLAAAIAFMYRGLDGEGGRLGSVIEDGVYAAANLDEGGRWAGEAESVDATIDIDWNPDVDDIYRRYKRGEGAQLTPTEIGILVRSGKIDPDDIEDLEMQGPVFPGAYFGRGLEVVASREDPAEE